MKTKIKILLEGIALPSTIFVVVTLIVSIFFGILGDIFKNVGAFNENSFNAVLLQGIADIIIIPILVPLYIIFKKKYGIVVDKFKISDIRPFIPVAFSICIISNILLQYLPIEEENEVSKEIFDLITEYNIYISLIIVSILIPIVEELLFRGYFFDAIVILSNKNIAVIITSICFAVIHGNITQGIYAFVAGLFFGYIKSRYNKVSYTIIMHLIMNFCSIVLAPAIIELTNFRQKMYAIFICCAILIFSIYRIKVIRRNYG